MKMLLLKYPNIIHTRTATGKTALHLAAVDGRKDIVDLLLRFQADVLIADNEGVTPLHFAAQGGWTEVVSAFVDRGAECEAYDKPGRTPLFLAAEAGKPTTVKLLTQGLRLEDILCDHALVVHAAMRSGNASVIETLLDMEVPVGLRDGSGLTAFAYAEAACDQEVLQRFLDQGANAEELDLEGTNLLHRMAAKNRLKTYGFSFIGSLNFFISWQIEKHVYTLLLKVMAKMGSFHYSCHNPVR
jgi:ankyrin repeat protein